MNDNLSSEIELGAPKATPGSCLPSIIDRNRLWPSSAMPQIIQKCPESK
jgi:hypothetical protein